MVEIGFAFDGGGGRVGFLREVLAFGADHAGDAGMERLGLRGNGLGLG